MVFVEEEASSFDSFMVRKIEITNALQIIAYFPQPSMAFIYPIFP